MLLVGFCCDGGTLGGVGPVSPPPASSFNQLGLLTAGEGFGMAGLASERVEPRAGLPAGGFSPGALASGGLGALGF